MHPLIDRALPFMAAAAVAAGASMATVRLTATLPGTTTVVTAARSLPAGTRLRRSDLTTRHAGTVTLPDLRRPLYTVVPLRAGEPVLAATVSAAPPARRVALGTGMVAENVTLPEGAVAGGVGQGSSVAVTGSVGTSGQIQLLSPNARVVAVSAAAVATGMPSARVYTLVLPLGSAIAVAAASHNGSVDLLPWSLPSLEVHAR